jgi:hypothetical protein
MTYLDVERLQTIDPASFRDQAQYPWVNPAGLLTHRRRVATTVGIPCRLYQRFGYY